MSCMAFQKSFILIHFNISINEGGGGYGNIKDRLGFLSE